MKKVKNILILLVLLFLCVNLKAQDNNEFYLHADHPASFGAAYGKNIGKIYSGLNVYVNPFVHRSEPEFISNLELGILIWQVQPFITGGFYTCGGEAKREGEGKQGFAYGGGLSGYYKHFKAQVSITTKTTKISFGYFWGW